MTATPLPAPLPRQRLTSLDAFRGATMAFMVLVNTPGTGDFVYPPLQHAHWHGWTPTDVVFPSFVWITGLAMTLSLGRKAAQQASSKPDLIRQAFRRALILFAMGMLIYSFPVPDPETFRILGVLQRIAICYLVAAVIYLYSSWRGQVLWTLGFLVLYWLLMFYAPVPGFGAGRLDVEGNFAHYVDRIVLGSHNYVNTKTWDPEGIVSTLPAIASCLLGILAGHMVALPWTAARRAAALAGFGVVLIGAGLIGDHWLPINKSIWTSTFALFMAGLDCVLFAGFLWVADGLQWGKWFRPFTIMGMNAIAVYMASELIDVSLQKIAMGGGVSLRVWLYQNWFAPLATLQQNASLLYAVVYTLLHFGLAWILYRRNWFLRV